jgi:OOP family OmpA-OmpF porin
MKLRQLLLAATVIATPGAAFAQEWYNPMTYMPNAAANPIQGVYLGAGIGWNHADKQGVTALGGNAAYFDGTVANRQGQYKLDEGYAGVFSIGYGFGNGLRTEVEGSIRYNEVGDIGGWQNKRRGVAGPGVAFSNSGGNQYQYGVMANLLYDFQLPRWFPDMPIPMVPYIGGGVGYMWTDLEAHGRRSNGGNRVEINDTDGQFAFQGIAGAAFPIESVPGLAVTLEYRYMGTLQNKFDGRVVTPTGATVSRGRYEGEQQSNQSVMLGLRYALYTPQPMAQVAPAPAPSVAPAPARTYLVFFDWDRADLTDRARQIIADAASNSTRVQSTRIEVSGHADRSGTPQYNQRLSARRADAVAAELVRNGVSRSAISVQAFGESRPLVATADGVREPQNRRVEIVLR